MHLLIDENVPDSVARYFAERGHEVQFVRELFAAGTADPVIAAIGDTMGAIVVTWDKDFRSLVARAPRGSRVRFRRLGRISFRCAEPRGRRRAEETIDLIEYEHDRMQRKGGDQRLIVEINETGIRITR